MLDYLVAAFSGPGAGFMYAITALLAFSLSIAVERSILLLLRWRPPAQGIARQLEEGDIEAALRSAGDTPLATVLRAGAAQEGAEAAWEAMSAATVSAEEQVRRRVGYLAAVANISTMLGLLGTVYGLVLAFSALGDAGAGERAVRLSEGISTAMATTAWGLVVGIPSLGLHAWLEEVAERRLSEIESSAGRLALALRVRRSDA